MNHALHTKQHETKDTKCRVLGFVLFRVERVVSRCSLCPDVVNFEFQTLTSGDTP